MSGCCSGGTGQTEGYVEYKTGETITCLADFGPIIDSRTLTGDPEVTFQSPADGTTSGEQVVSAPITYKGTEIPANTAVQFTLSDLTGVVAGDEAILNVAADLSDGDKMIMWFRVKFLG